MEKIRIEEGTEDFALVKKEWQAKAKSCTIETLPVFLKELTENYSHSYGTICHAVAVAAIAAACSVDRSPVGALPVSREGR